MPDDITVGVSVTSVRTSTDANRRARPQILPFEVTPADGDDRQRKQGLRNVHTYLGHDSLSRES